MVAQKQKPKFPHPGGGRGGPGLDSPAACAFIEPQWIHHLFGAVSQLIKYLLFML